MALTKCRECGGQVSTEATACPHCGAPVRPPSPSPIAPVRAKGARGTWLVIVAALVLFVAWVRYESSNSTPPDSSESPVAASSSPTTAPASPPAAPVAVAASCKSDYRLCSDNSDLVNNFDGISAAQFACKEATDEHVEYGSPDWPWVFYFSTFLRGNNYAKQGIVDLIDDRVKIQNEFGAMQHSRVLCEYDLRAKKVAMLEINGDVDILDATLFDRQLAASGTASAPSSAPSPAPQSSDPASLASGGPSGSYGAQLAALIRENTVYTQSQIDQINGNPKVVLAITLDPNSGEVLRVSVQRSSGVPSWDQAVMRAVRRVGTFPSDHGSWWTPIEVVDGPRDPSQAPVGRNAAVPANPMLGAMPTASPAVAASAAASAPQPSGPSFECARAFYPDEKAICESPALSALDRQTADLFERAAAVSADPAAFRKANVKYVIERRTCGASLACITAWYQRRQVALREDLSSASR